MVFYAKISVSPHLRRVINCERVIFHVIIAAQYLINIKIGRFKEQCDENAISRLFHGAYSHGAGNWMFR